MRTPCTTSKTIFTPNDADRRRSPPIHDEDALHGLEDDIPAPNEASRRRLPPHQRRERPSSMPHPHDLLDLLRLNSVEQS
ncbi:hypothetical protein Hypma_014672 [Hypsizygus marmoreus]|uniref:Uncharacterized protein n=1 Tax=Hypsizygus marmoreus TaxID=39966 RepID=A0A369JGZ9_HYPMA|nr:hypothetical protein Hypma_014672 [Hypsizygus marmoreus]